MLLRILNPNYACVWICLFSDQFSDKMVGSSKTQ